MPRKRLAPAPTAIDTIVAQARDQVARAPGAPAVIVPPLPPPGTPERDRLVAALRALVSGRPAVHS